MQTIREGVASLSLIARLTYDRLLVLFMVGSALFAASYMVAL